MEEDDMLVEDVQKPTLMTAPVRWIGGKHKMVPKLRHRIPKNRVYCEPFCGAANLFWNVEKHEVEVLNDIYGDIINLFRVLQDKNLFSEFRHRILWTPYSREEFVKALKNQDSADALERAWSTYVLNSQGFSGVARTEGNWGRTIFAGGQCETWGRKFSKLKLWHERLAGVQLDSVDALKCIRYWDSEDTTFYCDPPYPESTRTNRIFYKFELSNAQHAELVDLLLSVKGVVVLSSYENEIYQPLAEAGWAKETFKSVCYVSGAVPSKEKRKCTEVVWTNPRGIKLCQTNTSI